MFFNKTRYLFGLILLGGFIFLQAGEAIGEKPRIINVTATAYISRGKNSRTASGNKLKPGMKVIAVSPDLIKKGLTYGTKVEISGLPGKYTVLDKMHKRRKKWIDIYMGNNLKAAKRWGRRKVNIRW